MITLYQFPPVWGLPNASPFCSKVETYLRMAEIPYENHFVRDPRKAPKGKLPYIKDGGELIADSEFIIDHLKQKTGDVLDRNLTEEQKALSLLLEFTFSERLYWILVYLRWQEDAGWLNTKKAFFASLPSIPALFLPKFLRNKVRKTLYMQGTGRHRSKEILQMGYKTIDAIAAILGEKKYFQGDEITSIDATAFAFLTNIVWVPYADPLKEYCHQHKNLLNFCNKMWDYFYSELPKPFNLF